MTMSFYDFVKRFMGISIPEPHPFDESYHGFKSPIWDDSEDDPEDEFRNSPSMPFGFRVFTGNPLDIHRYFEQQIDEMLKSFKPLEDNFFGSALTDVPEDFKEKSNGDRDENIRKKYLKPSYEKQNGKSIRDTDIDDRIGDGFDYGTLIPSPSPDAPSFGHQVPNSAFGSSTVTQIIRLPGGRVEEKKIKRNSKGEEEVTVRREVDGQSHVVTTIKKSDGTSTINEELVNMDHGDMKNFESKWDKLDSGDNIGSTFKNQPQERSGILSILDKFLRR